VSLPNYAPTNQALVDPKTGKATGAFQIWLRDLWLQAGGVTGPDHGALVGLLDDDHTQYLTNARGDARYQPLDSDLTSIAALATAAYGRSLLTLTSYEELTVPYAVRFDQYDATTGYLGEAVPGVATSAASWRVKKLVFGVDGDVDVTYADGDANFNNVWDDRASLTYS
jgi:hypothetical protein